MENPACEPSKQATRREDLGSSSYNNTDYSTGRLGKSCAAVRAKKEQPLNFTLIKC